MPPATRKAAQASPVVSADAVDVTPPRRPNPGESSDPAVHQLLAHRQSAELNNDDAAMAAIDEQLAGLGY